MDHTCKILGPKARKHIDIFDDDVALDLCDDYWRRHRLRCRTGVAQTPREALINRLSRAQLVRA